MTTDPMPHSLPSVPPTAQPLAFEPKNNPADVTDAQPDQPNVTDGPLEGHPQYEHPGFFFAGANLGGEQVQNCRACGAAVQAINEPIHLAWHSLIGA